MGLLDFLRTNAKLPKFSVCIYGKLPCHREYLHVSVDPAFNELKTSLIQGIDVLTENHTPPPLIWPDRRFFVRMDGFKADLAGCVWDSSDGKRAFPFMMAVPLPKRYGLLEFPVLNAALSKLWTYVEHYYENLRGQSSGEEVYRRVRNVVHDLDPPDPPEHVMQTPHPVPSRLTVLKVPPSKEEAAQQVANLKFQEPPAFLLFPTDQTFKGQDQETLEAYVGFSGIADFKIGYFRPAEPQAPDKLDEEATLEYDFVEDLLAEEDLDKTLSDTSPEAPVLPNYEPEGPPPTEEPDHDHEPRDP